MITLAILTLILRTVWGQSILFRLSGITPLAMKLQPSAIKVLN